jgi:hypothetical protein
MAFDENFYKLLIQEEEKLCIQVDVVGALIENIKKKIQAIQVLKESYSEIKDVLIYPGERIISTAKSEDGISTDTQTKIIQSEKILKPKFKYEERGVKSFKKSDTIVNEIVTNMIAFIRTLEPGKEYEGTLITDQFKEHKQWNVYNATMKVQSAGFFDRENRSKLIRITTNMDLLSGKIDCIERVETQFENEEGVVSEEEHGLPTNEGSQNERSIVLDGQLPKSLRDFQLRILGMKIMNKKNKIEISDLEYWNRFGHISFEVEDLLEGTSEDYILVRTKKDTA